MNVIVGVAVDAVIAGRVCDVEKKDITIPR